MSAALTADQQREALALPAFPADVRTRAAQVFGALAKVSATAESVTFDVDGVPVTALVGPDHVELHAGRDADGRPLYSWSIPLTWIG